MRPARTVTALLAATLGAALLQVVPAAAAPVEPLLSESIEGYPDYDGADTCSPTAKPGAIALLDLLTTAHPDTYGYISRECSGSPNSEHNEGRAVDWMVRTDQYDLVDDMFDWIFATDIYGNENAMVKRLGIMYMIFDHEIWRAYDPGAGWQPYDGASPHTDHVHLSMSWDGAWQETSWTTGREKGMLLDQARFAATWRDQNRLDVFRRDQSGELQQRVWEGRWLGWHDLGGSLDSGPAAVWSSPKSLWVFAKGEDGDLLQRRWQKDRGWASWEDTGVPITSAPGVTAHGGDVHLFVRTPSGSLAYRSWEPKGGRRDSSASSPADAQRKRGWSAWTDLGGVLSAPPAAVFSTRNELDVFVRGMGGYLHQKVLRGDVWTPDWITLGGALTSGPSALSERKGTVSVYTRTVLGTITELTHVDLWSGWVDLGGMQISAPSATALRPGRRDLFTRDAGGELRQNYSLSGSGWSGWALR